MPSITSEPCGVDVSDSERRASERVEAIVVVELPGGLHGVTRDVSGTGLLIATRTPFSPGDRLELTIHSTSGTVRTKATVIRLERAEFGHGVVGKVRRVRMGGI